VTKEWIIKNTTQHFDEKTKKVCMSMMERIATAHNGIEQCEIDLMDKTKTLFSKK